MEFYCILLKQHNTTKLKYLCYHKGTINSCFKYCGSGKYWRTHIKKHGKNIKTTILAICTTHTKAKLCGLYYSTLWNIINSNEFANLITENANTSPPIISKAVHRQTVSSRRNRINQHGKTTAEHYVFQKLIIHYKINGFTKNQKLFHATQSKLQKNKSMKVRLNNANWVSPNIGKTMKERTANPQWISFACKAFTINGKNEMHCTCESDFTNKTGLHKGIARRIKRLGKHTIILIRKNNDMFNIGDVLELKC